MERQQKELERLEREKKEHEAAEMRRKVRELLGTVLIINRQSQFNPLPTFLTLCQLVCSWRRRSV